MAALLNLEDILRLLDEYFEDRKRAEADPKFTPYYEKTRDDLVEQLVGAAGRRINLHQGRLEFARRDSKDASSSLAA
jgi:hypothetical protein